MTTPSPSPLPAAKRSKRRVLIAVGVLAVLVAGVFGVRKFVHSLSYEDTDNAFIEGIVVRVSPRVPGPVVRVAVKDNQHVAAGDLLVEIDAKDIQNHLDGVRAALKGAESRLQSAQVDVDTVRKTAKAAVDAVRGGVEAAEASLETARVGFAASQSMLAQARTHLTAAKAKAEATGAEAVRAKKDLERYQNVYQSGGIPQAQLELIATAAQSASSAKVAADAQVTEAEAAIATAEDAVHQAESQVRVAEAVAGQARSRLAASDIADEQLAKSEAERNRSAADVEQLKAQVRQAELDLSYTRVAAPQAGTVTKKSVEEGDFVRPGQPLIGLVADEKWVVANFKETQLEHMKPGQDVEIHVDAYPAASFKGKVDSIQRGTGSRFSLLPSENATGNYVKVVQRVPVKITLEGSIPAETPLSLGMSVVPYVKVK
jgi:membrane fusion protein (multidrug efflux system)